MNVVSTKYFDVCEYNKELTINLKEQAGFVDYGTVKDKQFLLQVYRILKSKIIPSHDKELLVNNPEVQKECERAFKDYDNLYYLAYGISGDTTAFESKKGSYYDYVWDNFEVMQDSDDIIRFEETLINFVIIYLKEDLKITTLPDLYQYVNNVDDTSIKSFWNDSALIYFQYKG